MSALPPPSTNGPATHYALFAGMLAAEVSFLVTGAVALVLHGVPRLTADIDLAIASDSANVHRLERLLAAWGYGEAVTAAAATAPPVRRFRHPSAALGEIDTALLETPLFTAERDRAPIAPLVDIGIPFVGAEDLLAIMLRAGAAAHADVAALHVLAAIRSGAAGDDTDTGREQIRKFSRWSVAARLDWLLASARLARGLAPEARPMTRGLVRRRGWYGAR